MGVSAPAPVVIPFAAPAGGGGFGGAVLGGWKGFSAGSEV